jgi:imidazolonepropionase
MLTAIELAKTKYQHMLTIVSTFCGAHAIPKGRTEYEQTKDVIEQQLPAIKKAIDAKLISPTFIDVFCEKNFFEVESSQLIMEEGKKIGLIPSFHGD